MLAEPSFIRRYLRFFAVAMLVALAPVTLADASKQAQHAQFVGSQFCAGCHQPQFQAWQKSHHHQAMAVASSETVLADFSNITFDDGHQALRFFRDGEKYLVDAEGIDGARRTFRIAYTFGIEPLQQYLVEMADGRLQALTVAWDTRDGEGRWFNLRPGESNAAGSPLHWTGSAYTANAMCIECHSTAFEKNYDADADRYTSRWHEAGVGCESCHGPGGDHRAMMSADSPPASNLGFDFRLSRKHWMRADGAAIAVPLAQLSSELMLDVCAPCHSRRATLSEAPLPGDPLFDHYRPSWLEDGLYYTDGQIHDEVFVWGSFTQSRMHAAGVTCNDCHDPHGMGLRVEGDGLCLGCHSPEIYSGVEHSFHERKSIACVDCHMPATTYMEVDPRRDHRFGIPRPDLSEQIGAPNACASCHDDMTSQQLADAIRAAQPDDWRPRDSIAPEVHGARQGRRTPALARWAADKGLSAITRATLIAEVGESAQPTDLALLAAAHQDEDPLVRIAALSTLPRRLDRQTLQHALNSLTDERKSVRIEAVRALLPVPAGVIESRYRPARLKATQEYEDTLALNADQAQSLVALAELRATQGRMQEALAAFDRSMSRHPYFLPAYANSADLRRQTGDEAGARRVLKRGLQVLPDEPDLHFALGLAHVRNQNMTAAMPALAEAVRLSGSGPNYAYTYAIALESQGRLASAIDVLERAVEVSPNAEQLSSLLENYRAKLARGG